MGVGRGGDVEETAGSHHGGCVESLERLRHRRTLAPALRPQETNNSTIDSFDN